MRGWNPRPRSHFDCPSLLLTDRKDAPVAGDFPWGPEGLEQLPESDACTVRRDDREDSRRHKPTASKLECYSYL